MGAFDGRFPSRRYPGLISSLAFLAEMVGWFNYSLRSCFRLAFQRSPWLLSRR